MNPIITRIVATEVVVPAREGHVDRSAFGPSLFDKKPKWILEVYTDNDLVGFGETPRTASEAHVRWGAQQVLGKSLLSLPWRAPVPPNLAANDAYGHPNPPVPYRFHEPDFTVREESLGIEVALLDLWGKVLGLPLHALFGGAYREWVATSWWFGRSNAEHAARQTEIGARHGFTGVKLKATVEDDVVGIVRAIKSIMGDRADVVVDPNYRFYRLSEALRIAKELEQFSNVLLEDPFPFDVREWQLLRQKTSVPLVIHYHTPGLIQGIREHCCDHVNLEYPACRFLGDAHMAWRLGMLCWHGSGVELGILDAYMLHSAAAARNCVLPGDALGHRIRVDDLIEEQLELRKGKIRVPTKPGLGVTLDRKALARFAKRQIELKP